MKSLTWVLRTALADASARCDADTSRDILTIERRVKDEGDSFLTITLPAFCSDFERCLDSGLVVPGCFLGFKKTKSLPAFLQGLMELIFDKVSGELLPKPSSEAVLCIRQVCLMFKKLQRPCSPERVSKAYDKFVECEYEVRVGNEAVSARDRSDFRALSSLLWTKVLKRLDGDLACYCLAPKHGPGATAERISGNQKYNLHSWHDRLEVTFPVVEYGIPSYSALGELTSIDFIEPGAEPPVRVITVPKTLKTPRIIAIEPVCMQYTQQAVAKELMYLLEHHSLTRGHVNFSNQKVNRDLAFQSSITGCFATIDLSEASDRVSALLVSDMLDSIPLVRDAVFACRSRSAAVEGEILPLNKFASMGSALCFPIESMVFYTLLIFSEIRRLNLPISMRSIELARSTVFVYGDDLIVPSDAASHACSSLEAFGLKVNSKKSFWTGKFRESCGMDAYDGIDVTPVYIRNEFPTGMHDVSSVVSAVATANHFYSKGWWRTAQLIRDWIEDILGPLPYVADTASCLGWRSVRYGHSVQGWDSNLHTPLVKSYVTRTRRLQDTLDGYPALMKFFLQGPVRALGMNLDTRVDTSGLALKRKWVRPY